MQEAVGRSIMVQVVLGKNTKPYLKNNLNPKGPEMWLK
jgi:hypothetical protein